MPKNAKVERGTGPRHPYNETPTWVSTIRPMLKRETFVNASMEADDQPRGAFSEEAAFRVESVPRVTPGV